jgi:carboxypeptidase family protein
VQCHGSRSANQDLTRFGQTATRDILGTVFDPTGAVVAEAKVTLRSMDTTASKEEITGGPATFRFRLLPVGSYEVTVGKTVFAKYVQGPIILRLNQAADPRIALTLSGKTETIVVSTDAPLRS